MFKPVLAFDKKEAESTTKSIAAIYNDLSSAILGDSSFPDDSTKIPLLMMAERIFVRSHNPSFPAASDPAKTDRQVSAEELTRDMMSSIFGPSLGEVKVQSVSGSPAEVVAQMLASFGKQYGPIALEEGIETFFSAGGEKGSDVANAFGFRAIAKRMKIDPSYAAAWHATVAASVREFGYLESAVHIADHWMKNAFGITTPTPPKPPAPAPEFTDNQPADSPVAFRDEI